MADRIYVVHSLVENTYEEYSKIYEETKDWEYIGCAGNEILNEVNQGDSQDAANARFVAFLCDCLPEMQEAVKAMRDTLEVEKETIKGLINMCDDFVEILRGEDQESLEVYKNFKPKTDILYFNDRYALCDIGYQGSINDNSRDVYFKSDTEKTKLEDAKLYLDQVETRDGIDLDISSQLETITDCYTKQRYVVKLFSALKAYGDGVKACNENVKAGLEPYVEELGITLHRRSFRYDDVETENNAYIITVMTNILGDYGVTADDIEAAEKVGITLEDLTEYYCLMESDEARNCFTHVLRQEYEDAFSDSKGKIYDDASLLTALSIYSFAIMKVNEKGVATAESCEDFQAFVNGILSANKHNSNKDLSGKILKNLYAYSTVLAEAYTLSSACVDPSDPNFSKYILEANKKDAICSFYYSEYNSLKSLSGHNPYYNGGQFDEVITDLKFSNKEISYKNKIGEKTYPVFISQITSNNYKSSLELSDEVHENEEARAKILGEVFANMAKSTIALSCPEIGAAITLVSAFVNGASAGKHINNSIDLMTKLLDGDKSLSGSVKISVDMVEGLYKYALQSDDSAKMVQQNYFGYEYFTQHEKSNIAMLFNGGTEQVMDSNALSFLRPEGIIAMKNIEDNGIYGIATEDQRALLDIVLNPGPGESPIDFENKDMIDLLLYGKNENGEKLDFSSVDYQELMDAVVELNRCCHINYEISVEDIIHDEMNEIRGYEF